MDSLYSDSAMSTSREQPVFACNLLALSPAQREEHSQVTKQLMDKVLARKELLDGYAFQFAPQADTLPLLAHFVMHERLCCPFFTFTILVEPAGGPFWLHLTGQEGIQAFIRAELNW